MSVTTNSPNRRIAKNTIVLYSRTIVTMIVALYTSRIVLNSLGVEDYGIYSVIAGFVSMLSILSGSLSSSISRFITYELGKGDKSRLASIFNTSILILVMLALVVIVVGEIVGVWYLNTYMQIPCDRLSAANWTYQCSLMIFVCNLLYVPYNACIIAHERMTAFAYVSIADVTMKLLIAYLISSSPFDKLIFYAILLLIQSVSIGLVYVLYCNRYFAECKYVRKYNRHLVQEMTGFAGWAFLTSGTAVMNTQGLNILINFFFGVMVNAARGIASQVESVLMKFVNDFTTAINPQITKNYAEGKFNEMYNLICRGAKFSFFLLLLISLPFIFETKLILQLWLGIVPEHTVNFFRLTMISSMIIILGNTSITGCLATGRIKSYTIVLTSIGLLVFPITALAFYLGLPPEFSYVTYIAVYTIILFVRLFLMKHMIGFPVKKYITEVLYPIIKTSCFAIVLPFMLNLYIEDNLIGSIAVMASSIIMSALGIFIWGLSKSERELIINLVKSRIRK